MIARASTLAPEPDTAPAGAPVTDTCPWEVGLPGVCVTRHLGDGTWVTRYADGSVELTADVPGLARLALTLLPTAARSLAALLQEPTT